MASCNLYQNSSSTINIIDIPKSIELARGDSQSSRRLLSSDPSQHPFPSLEPKSAKARANLGGLGLSDLLIQKHLEFVLDEIAEEYEGEWCLPRVTECDDLEPIVLVPGRKRKQEDFDDREIKEEDDVAIEQYPEVESENEEIFLDEDFYFHNPNQSGVSIQYGPDRTKAYIPPKSTVLFGDISNTKDIFIQHAPKFNLVIMDPPWPNRSARRKKDYRISYNTSSIHSLLSSIPVPSHFTDDGLLCIWITNKPIFRALTLQLFTEWGVTLIEECIWLKVTAKGEPIYKLDSLWRKPYEMLLVGKRGAENCDIKRRVLVGVPDLHSRKPNLKALFEGIMERREGTYEALEVFARNLTAGWWGWGDEVLKFQGDECWIDGCSGEGENLE